MLKLFTLVSSKQPYLERHKQDLKLTAIMFIEKERAEKEIKFAK